MRRYTSFVGMFFCLATILQAQDRPSLPLVKDVERQPLVAQVRRLTEALDFLGSRQGAA